MNDAVVIGVDVGGTKLAYVVADRAGRVLAEFSEPTHSHEGYAATVRRIGTTILRLREQAGRPVIGVGVGTPGAIDHVSGHVHNAVNLSWVDVPLTPLLHEVIGPDLPVWLGNDVNAVALGELVFGAARGCSDIIYLAVGTGLGGGAIVDGRVVNGFDGHAMEVGHTSLDPRGRLCACGGHGCAEMYVSGIGLLAGVEAYHEHHPKSTLAEMVRAGREVSTHVIVEAARAGDSLAQQVFAEASAALGTVAAWCAMLFNPERIVIGGGLGHAAADLLLDGMADMMRARMMPGVFDQITIVRSEVQTSALGPAALVWHALEEGSSAP